MKDMTTTAIAERSLGIAINRLQMFHDGEMSEPALLLESIEELGRLQRAHSRVKEEMENAQTI
ncbi:hypothetical protein GR11A_00179 [Vibrio phage vB_VcorM_GR11A]|nr:hypothetical protein GR11A_00179 [Vibrio phage vB_VcorM_GR11A]